MNGLNGDLVESIDEVLSNAEATQGVEFVQCVAVFFEVAQLVDVLVKIARAANIKPDDNTLAACFELVHSLAGKAIPDLDDDKTEEATKVADKLMEIRGALAAAGPGTPQ